MNAPPNQSPVQVDDIIQLRWQEYFSGVFSAITAMQQSGTTAQRPTKGLWVGRQYFDTTLGYPVYLKSANPSIWVNGSGAVV
jgi:hypothetical protein